MEFESKALGFRVKSSEMDNPGEFLDKLVQEELEFYENLDNHEKGESASLIFEDGSKLYIYRPENDEEEFKDKVIINYLPDEGEDNYAESQEVIDSVDNALTGIGYETEYLTVGSLLKEEIDKLVKEHVSKKSEFEIDGIELRKDNCIYGITNKTNSENIRVTIRVRNEDQKIPPLKTELKDKLEDFVEI